MPVIYVPGNHEFYAHDIGLTDGLKVAAVANIHFLNNDTLELGGVRFVGSTLWTDFKLYGEGKLAAIFCKTMGMASLSHNILSGLAGKIEVTFVFGSTASGQQKPAVI